MPTAQELIFALRTFAGAMLALYIAFWLGLENPYWSMATAYIVAQPFTGAMRSKALYRFFGTLIGGAAAVALVPNLVDAPVLLCLALSGWIGLCLYISLLDRTPRAYTFMLAGYTAGIIGFPSVTAPGDIFTTALTRVEEISIGIACTTLAGSIFFPRALGPVLAARLREWAKPGSAWAVHALAGDAEDEAARRDRHNLAVEAADVAMLTSQLAYDTSPLQSATRHVVRFRLYMLSLMPVLSSIGTRVAQLRAHDGLTPPLTNALQLCAAWVGSGETAGADAVRRSIDALPPEDAASWASILRIGLVQRLSELVSLVCHARQIRLHVADGAPEPPSAALEGAFVAAADQVRDHGLALYSGAAAALATLLVCAFWIETGWTSGAGAAVMVAVACSFFAAQDDPAPAIQLMLRNALIATVFDAAYIFVILPRVETFAGLMIALLPAGLVVGVLVSRPATFGTGMVLGAVGSTILGLENGYIGDFAGYANSTLGLVGGLAAAVAVTRLIRSLGAAWSAERLLRANWRDIAAAAGARAPRDRAHMTAVMLDRMGQLMPRLAGVAQKAGIAAADVLHDLRVGLNVIGLRAAAEGLAPATQRQLGDILREIAAHYRADPLQPPPPSLLRAVDAAITNIAQTASGGARRDDARREALVMLAGLRSLLFAQAPPPVLAPAPAPAPPVLLKAG